MTQRYAHKSQHFVPRTYLAEWCDPSAPTKMEPYVWVFDRDGRTGRRKAPQNIFEENNFYTIRSDGERDLTFEQNLHSLETRFANIRHQKIATEMMLDLEEHSYVAAFVVAMSFRTRAHREFRRRQWQHVVNAMRELAAERGPQGEVPEVRFSGSDDPSQPSLTLEEVSKLADNPVQFMLGREIGTYIPIVGRLRAQIIRTDDRIGFITCDDPCVWLTAEGTSRRPPPLNQLGEPYGVFMPLSPRQMLFLNPYHSEYGKAPDRLVTWLNAQTRRQTAENFVVCRNEVREEWFGEPRDISEV